MPFYRAPSLHVSESLDFDEFGEAMSFDAL
jgi:hypothetical protein